MENVLDKKMFSYFTQLNEQEKKSIIEMLKVFLNGRLEKRIGSVSNNIIMS